MSGVYQIQQESNHFKETDPGFCTSYSVLLSVRLYFVSYETGANSCSSLLSRSLLKSYDSSTPSITWYTLLHSVVCANLKLSSSIQEKASYRILYVRIALS